MTELHDARDVQSANDVLALVQRFARPSRRIQSFEDVTPALKELSCRLNGSYGIFMVDQFESTFQSAEVYCAYEYVALCISRESRGLIMVFSRKDDLLTRMTIS